jgi:hypothetical protein
LNQRESGVLGLQMRWLDYRSPKSLVLSLGVFFCYLLVQLLDCPVVMGNGNPVPV